MLLVIAYLLKRIISNIPKIITDSASCNINLADDLPISSSRTNFPAQKEVFDTGNEFLPRYKTYPDLLSP
jgi:hypothetical protein